MDAGVAAQRTSEEVVGILNVEMDGGEDKAAAPKTDEPESFFGITGADRFISHIGNERVERIAFGGVVVENARRQGTTNGRNFHGFARGVSHAEERGKKCAKGKEDCFESEG